MARYDFGMTWEEFGRTTPGMFLALMKRLNVRFRHDCYTAGIVASMIANVNRKNDQAKVWSPFDFVPDAERDKRRGELKKQILALFGTLLEFNKSPDAIDKARDLVIARLTKAGHTDVEGVFDEVFPHWEKKKDK
jgi:hypothetical protein